MSRLKNFSTIVLFLFTASSLWAIEDRNFVGGNSNSSNSTNNNSYRAACIEARSERDLDINNVRARLRTGGDLWWDGDRARYIVPNVDPASGQPEVSSLFAGGIWLGAFDDGGNLILAAQTYRQTGNDYWTGPLDVNTGTIEKTDCEKWDRFFEVYGSEIDALRADYFEPDPVTGQPDESIENRPARNILGWPGRGNPYFAEIYGFDLPDQELAPFIEPPGKEDGIYNPYDGDHPVIEVVGCPKDYFNPVYADQMDWWVYNDNGNIHTNTNGQPMFMEVHGLAFGYRTTDAINNMTFYRYKLLNRNNLSLNDTYFSLWSDPDLGCFNDDYIGVDTITGMGYVYNADADDDATCGNDAVGYGAAQIPALGVDYFRGPLDSTGSELGLSSFVYYENTNDAIRGNPNSAVQYYRLMDGLWLDGRPISRGGTGDNGPTATKFPYVFYSFPNESGTDVWSMCEEGITGNDYRFLHTSGPFLLAPGAVNELISGVVWVPEIPDYPCPALTELVEADILAQNLFDDCFKITDGPDAPYMDVVELENELILNLSYVPAQNNYELNYSESPAILRNTADTTYTFQGYKVYQVINENISVTELNDPEKARLIRQVDLRDSIGKIVNWNAFSDPDVQAFIPTIMVDGADEGVKHTFNITTDEFAEGSSKLVNHKSYYFCVVAYAHNEYQAYDPTLNTGQALPYLQGRRNFRVYTAVPRPNDPEYNGLVLNSAYGDGPEITRVDGKGNGGGLFLDFKDPASAEADVLNNGRIGRVTYAAGQGPVNVKVVDPLRVPAAQFQLYISDQNYTFRYDTAADGSIVVTPQPPTGVTALSDSLFWLLKDANDPSAVWSSYQPLDVNYEQYIPDLGISLLVEDIPAPGTNGVSGFVGSAAVYEDETTSGWFQGVEDGSGINDMLKTGNAQDDQALDPNQDYSGMAGGWHPVRLADCLFRTDEYYFSTSEIVLSSNALSFCQTWRAGNTSQVLGNVRNVNVVLTPEKSQWSRCAVVESASMYHTQSLGLSTPGGYGQLQWKRNEPSRDIDGQVEAGTGMSWFPGFAYDVETGERLNVYFGENSLYDGSFFDANTYPGAATGNDMLFNPTDLQQVTPTNGFPVFGNANIFMSTVNGGQHVIYVTNTAYDECASVVTALTTTLGAIFTPPYISLKDQLVWGTFMYMAPGTSMLNNAGVPEVGGHVPPSKVTFKLRVSTPYEIYTATNDNQGYPLYEFDLTGLAPTKEDKATAESALDLIGVVPNPYYAYSEYEQTETQNVVKITNLPASCEVNIYSIEGRLVRHYDVAQDYNAEVRSGIARLGAFGSGDIETQVSTSLNWDLKNQSGVPVGSGVYLIHVVVEGVGEKVVKSFVINRALDAQKL